METREAPFSAEDLAALVWYGPETGLAVYDADGHRLRANPAAESMLPSEGGDDVRPVLRALRGETVRGEQVELGGRQFAVSAWPVRLPDGSAGAVTGFLDVTALLEGRTAELRAANDELEAFSYSVSHDLRAPVRAVQGFARILRRRHAADLPEEGRALLERVEDQAVRMGELIDSLLRLSRMQRQPMTTTAVDMADLVARCWQAVLDDRPGAGVELVVGDLLPADGDAQLLRQVWANLLDNAVKYSHGRAGARVDVRSHEEAGSVVYEIRDNGAGFDPRYSDKLFQAFQRLHRENEFSGVGIGLAIVHRVVQRHGGHVWATARPGEGATFSFSLRKAAGHEAA